MKVNNSKGQLTFQIDINHQQKNGFRIGCSFKSTGKIGVIYPTQALPVNYGDSIKNNSEVALQFNPLAVPIMANMFIKQEHYYIPYNCVWQNWDNFISGGEEMDFTTPPPMLSLRRCFDALFGTLGYGILSPKLVFNRTDVGNGIYQAVISKESVLSDIAIVKQNVTGRGRNLGISDLLRVYVLDVLEKMEKLINDYNHANYPGFVPSVTNTDLIPIFRQEFEKNVQDPLNNNLRLPEDYVLPEYWKEVEQAVKSTAQYYSTIGNSQILDGVYKLYPTEFMLNFVDLWYDLYKPFIGIGSYVDCLNMFRYLPRDFNYLVWMSFLEQYHTWLDSAEETSDLFLQLQYNIFVSNLQHVALNLRCQYLVWYNNYRDQLLELDAFKPSKLDTMTNNEILSLLVPRHRCWEKDSYTTALDNPATGDAVVPLLNQRTVDVAYQTVKGAGEKEVDRSNMDIYEIKFADGTKFRIPTNFLAGINPKDGTGIDTANNFFSLHVLDAVKRGQKFLRKALYYGNRIQDFIYTTWGVKYLDARLRLPEILATSSAMADLQTLVNNTTTAESVAGDRAGFAKAYDKGNGFDRYCEEAGVIMSFLTVMPEPTYGFGCDRQYFKTDRFDYPIPEFATLGMDAVYDNELVICPNIIMHEAGVETEKPLVFGYQGRYYDSKFRQSTEHGELLTTQDMYTFGRQWNIYDKDGRPKLNYEFVHCFPPLDMFVMEDKTQDYFRFDVTHNTLAELVLPYHSIYL